MTLPDPCRAAAPRLHVLILPGWQDSDERHWQSRWQAVYGDLRVEQNEWHWPLRGDWMMRLDEVIADLVDAAAAGRAGGDPAGAAPVEIALVAHSLGCQLVAAWAAHSKKTAHVRAALLVAPPDVERADMPPQLHSFTPIVRARLPFPALAVYSDDDAFCRPDRALEMASAWQCETLALGPRGHINADSGLGDWPQGRALLAGLLAAAPERVA